MSERLYVCVLLRVLNQVRAHLMVVLCIRPLGCLSHGVWCDECASRRILLFFSSLTPPPVVVLLLLGIALCTQSLNALSDALIADINTAARALDDDDSVGAIVITGSEKAFAAGADIKEMADKNFIDCYTKNMFAQWADLTKIRKPVRGGVQSLCRDGETDVPAGCDK